MEKTKEGSTLYIRCEEGEHVGEWWLDPTINTVYRFHTDTGFEITYIKTKRSPRLVDHVDSTTFDRYKLLAQEWEASTTYKGITTSESRYLPVDNKKVMIPW